MRNKPPGAEEFERGNAYRFRTDGDRDENLLRAIACYQSALAKVPAYARPVVLLSLGHAYRDRNRGSLEDLRQAVEYYRQAVSCVPANDPASLAWAQACLGSTYVEMADEFDAASADEIEEAITLLTAASQAPGLTVERQELVTRALGEAYNIRERGDRAVNVEQALLYFGKALAAGGPPEPEKRMVLLVSIAILNMERAGGNRSDNVEAAIATLTEAERLLGSSALDPRLRAIFTPGVQRTLGDAYAARVQGDPAANREAALEHHRAAAAAVKPGTPDWVDVTSAVADDLIRRLRGDPSADLEEALVLVRRVLGVLDEHDFRWAATMSKLGSVYRQRIAGDKAENVEQAIRCYQAALTVMTRELSPLDWAQQQNNLGNAYAERLLGDRVDNLLQSAACLRSAADVFGPSVLPQWAGTLANLAMTYEELDSYGEPDALRRAVECLRQALTVADKLDPARRAMIQQQLGHAVFRLAPDSPSAVQQAIGYLEAALRVFTADSAPAYWAMTMYNLGSVQLRAGDRDGAIGSLRAALSVRTWEAMPFDWARTRVRLAEAYRMGGDYPMAESCLEPTAGVFRSLGALEWLCSATAMLAETRADRGDWVGAVRAFGEWLDAAEASYARAVLPAGKEAELELTGTVHAAAAYAAVRAGAGAATAARWLESGRARMLGDALARDAADLALLRQHDPAVAARFEAAVREQRQLDAEPDAPRAENLRPDAIRARDEARRDRYRKVAEEYAAAVAAARTALGRPGFLTTESPGAAGSAAAPLVYVAATRRGGLAVVLRGGAAEPLELPALLSSDLVPRVNRFLAASSAAADAEAWQAEVDAVTRWLWTAGLGDVADAVSGADIVTLIPCGALGVLPLHAAWQPDASRPTGRRYLIDTAPVAYAPSARVLDACAPLASVAANRLLAVADPQPVKVPPLRLAAQEASVAAARLPGGRVLASSEATVDAAANALSDASVAHFACHGRADLGDPGRSGLVLAHDQMLDVRRIRAQQIRLRLAILSACETAQAGAALPDEVIGLPAALLQAGVGGVLATWWPVPDDLALAVMLAFYERWDPASAASSPAVALAQAQQWLRDASNAKMRGHLDTLLGDPGTWLPHAALESSWENVILQDPQERPFASPATWGAFGYYGL